MDKAKLLLEKSKTMKKIGALSRHSDYQSLINVTNFLSADASVSERLWHIENNTTQRPKCKICDNLTNWRWEIRTYNTYCGQQCVLADRQNKVDVSAHKHPRLSQNTDIIEPVKTKPKRVKPELVKPLIEPSDESVKQTTKVLPIFQVPKLSQLNIDQLKQRFDNSSTKQQIYDYLVGIVPESVDVVIDDDTILNSQSIDISIKQLNLAIEVNEIYWHSELAGKDRRYHYNKMNECKSKGLQLINIFDSEWKCKQFIVKSRLAHLCKQQENNIYARKLKVVKLQSSDTKQFMLNSHIQGYASSSINLGLIDNNEILACMTFGIPRYNNNTQYELLRYATKPFTNIVGGASKLLTHFKREYNPNNIVSYADSRWSVGNLYNALGFKFDGVSAPNYFYFVREGDTTQLSSRVQFQKHKLPIKLEKFDPELTEWQNMVVNGYDRIWDCGNTRWIWEKQM